MNTSDTFSIRDVLNHANSDLGKLNAAAKIIQSYNRLLDTVLEQPLRSHLSVANLRDNQLVLMADSPAWASRARLRLPEIHKAIVQGAPVPSVDKILLITRPGPAAAPAPGLRRAHIISETSRKLLNDVAEDSDNPGLRRALRSIARRET